MVSDNETEENRSAVIGKWRERPPTSYLVKFESFRTLLNLVKDGKYVSRPFTVGGYNWYIYIKNLNFVCSSCCFFVYSQHFPFNVLS